MSQPLTTTAEDFGHAYFAHGIGNSPEPYAWSSPHWRHFFTETARRVVALFPDTRTALDVGSASGLFVQALVEQGVDARGFDVSDAALASADPAVRDRLSLRSATEPVAGRYDLVACIEVLEHLAPADAQQALDHLCAATDRILFSSTPEDFTEPTHVNVRPPADWAAAFALRGFYRRTDIDASFLSPWAVVFERGTLTSRDLVHRYETLLAPLSAEVTAKREALLTAQRKLTAATETSESGELAQLRQQNRDLEHEVLRLRDHAIGAEATAGSALAALDRAREELADLRASETFKLMTAALKPVAVVKRSVKKVLR